MNALPMTYAEVRAAHIAAAQATESGRVTRPGGKLIGTLAPYLRPWRVDLLPARERRHWQGGGTAVAGLPPRRMVVDWRIVPETRQMRRAQERKEARQ